MAAADSGVVAAYIEDFSTAYEAKHRAFENNFWACKMHLAGCSTADLSRTKNELDAFLGDAAELARVRGMLGRSDLTDDQRRILAIFERTFLCYIIEDADALAIRHELIELETQLEADRRDLKLGYVDPKSGEFRPSTTTQLREYAKSADDEAMRRACHDALLKIGPFVASKFAQIIRLRTRLANKLGYKTFYEMKVQQAEGFGTDVLFQMLDKLERDTRPIFMAARDKIAARHGESALLPHNIGYYSSGGDVTTLKDPYFPFDNAVDAWARSFAAMNISYKGATMQLDLCDRDLKYSNGFCHWPQPAWQSAKRGWVPSQANFTSLATPGQVGSGLKALETLMHEGGHAAHFANVVQPTPLASQERAPTSIPYAETQSMFLDSLVHDAAWLGRYSLSKDGDAIPWDIIEKDILSTHDYEVFALRTMIVVPYFEKRLYELPVDEVTPERVLQIADEVEKDIQCGGFARPLMMVPHFLSDESAAYYHGYVLADMAVHQTRKHFLTRYGTIVDNPHIGEDLKNFYWKSGNSRMYLDLVRDLTGKDLSGDAWVEKLNEPVNDRLEREKVAYAEAIAAGPKIKPGERVDLDMRIRLVHGDEVISDSSLVPGGVTEACSEFRSWIGKTFK